MRPLRSLMIFLAVIFIGGALIAPWVYWAAQWSASIHPALRELAQNPFHRFVSRSFLILALIGLWPFFRSLGIRSWREVGLCAPAGQWIKLAGGLALGFASLACAALLSVGVGDRTTDLSRSAAEILRHLVNASLAAIVVGTLEEVLFRGALFGALRKVHGWRLALVVSSVIYALLHFFARPTSPEPINWTTGIILLGQMLGGFVEVQHLVPGFFSLMLAGILLALAYQRTGNLYFSIGLHAGWIFWLKSYGFLTNGPSETHSWLWGTGKLLDGWMAFFVLVLALVIFLRLPWVKKKESCA